MNDLIFLHMTKTAGGSIKESLESENCSEFLFHNFSNPNKAEASEYVGRGSEYRLIFGHSIYGIHKPLEVEPQYGVFLREPIARVISHFYHLYNVDQGVVGERIRKHPSIDHFFRDDMHWEFSNFMCRVISGYGGKKVSDVKLFDQAVKNLDSFRYVGFLEYLGYSLGRLGSILRHDFTGLGMINQGQYNQSEVSQSVLKKIFDMNLQDRKLYEYALRTQLPRVVSDYYFGRS